RIHRSSFEPVIDEDHFSDGQNKKTALRRRAGSQLAGMARVISALPALYDQGCLVLNKSNAFLGLR
ncbi:MAG: hypothetical protein ACXW52_22555, partial [Candidatus Binatia bacterium]